MSRPARGSSHTSWRYPDGELRHAWKTLLQNHPHDSICGCSIDAVHEENMTRFARARQVADAVIESALGVVADSVPAAEGDTLRVLVVNTDAAERAQVVEATIDLPVSNAEPWRHVDAAALDRPVTFWPAEARITSVTVAGGDAVPFQILDEQDVIVHEMSRFETPWALHARRIRLVFWAPSLPPCGYQAFDSRDRGGIRAGGWARCQRHRSIGRERLASHDRQRRRESGCRREIDGHRLSRCGIARRYAVTSATNTTTVRRRRIRESRLASSSARRVCAGPLRVTFRIELELSLPAEARPDRRGRETRTVATPVRIDATLDAGSPRVTFTVTVDNTARDHRLRMLFPTGATEVAFARADTAFDVVTRPARRDVPATVVNEAPVSSAPMLSVVDAGDDRTGAMVIAKGLNEYEIVQDAVAVTLIRAVGDLSRNDLATRPSGHAGPPVATPGAQCPGRHEFTIAFEPRGAQPPAARILSSARALTVPPRVVAARMSGGNAPTRRSFLTLDRQPATSS